MQQQDSSIQQKNQIGRISEVIPENINKKLRNKLQLQQWNNTTAVINWFKKIENKYKLQNYDIRYKNRPSAGPFLLRGEYFSK